MYSDKLKKLTKQLYPTGRAFNVRPDSIVERLHDALIISENQMYSDAASTLYTILPDNANFTTADATRWEQRLGMITNVTVSLADRKLAIIRKMNHPGTILARQSHDYLQDSLQAAGFDLYVYENLTNLSVWDILSLNPGFSQWGANQFGNAQFANVFSYFSALIQIAQWGNNQFGTFNWAQPFYTQKLVNNIDYIKDIPFNTGTNNKSAFFVGANTLGTFADIGVERREELRQLILRIKPAQSVGYLLINYV